MNRLFPETSGFKFGKLEFIMKNTPTRCTTPVLQSTIIQLCYMKLENRFSLRLSCAYFQVIFKVFVIGLYWTRKLVVSRRLKWMELFQLIIFFKLFLTVTLMKHWIQSF